MRRSLLKLMVCVLVLWGAVWSWQSHSLATTRDMTARETKLAVGGYDIEGMCMPQCFPIAGMKCMARPSMMCETLPDYQEVGDRKWKCEYMPDIGHRCEHFHHGLCTCKVRCAWDPDMNICFDLFSYDHILGYKICNFTY